MLVMAAQDRLSERPDHCRSRPAAYEMAGCPEPAIYDVAGRTYVGRVVEILPRFRGAISFWQ